MLKASNALTAMHFCGCVTPVPRAAGVWDAAPDVVGPCIAPLGSWESLVFPPCCNCESLEVQQEQRVLSFACLHLFICSEKKKIYKSKSDLLGQCEKSETLAKVPDVLSRGRPSNYLNR